MPKTAVVDKYALPNERSHSLSRATPSRGTAGLWKNGRSLIVYEHVSSFTIDTCAIQGCSLQATAVLYSPTVEIAQCAYFIVITILEAVSTTTMLQ